MKTGRIGLFTLVGLLLLSSAGRTQDARASRPNPEAGPTQVTLAIVITDIAAIDDVAETMTLDFAVAASWLDPRLAWEPQPGVETRMYEIDEIWHPRLNVLNGRDLDASLPFVADVHPDGRVEIVQRLHGELALNMALRTFPLDRQEFALEIVSVRNRTETVELVVDERSALLPEAQLPGWKLTLREPRLAPLTLEGGGSSGMPRAAIIIEGEREFGYYLWTMVVPLTFIVFMAWTVFWIHPSFLPPMVGVATASAFSLIAYRTALRLSLPKVAYMTRADIFILGATILVFSALGVAIASNRMVRAENEEGAVRLQRGTRVAYVVAFAVLIVVSLTW